MKGKLRFAIIGTGFWAQYQIPAWLELEGVELIALYNRTKAKAQILADKYNIATVYDDIDALFKNETLDFVDIITDVDSHPYFVTKATTYGVHIICQKPMAASFELAERMVLLSKINGLKFFVHENFRWQAPIRKVKKLVESNVIGTPFKARVSFCSAFPVFDNQPFLATLDQFILTDIGSHVLDICRYLFGEVSSLYCQTYRVNPNIKGEDVANVLMQMQSGLHCFVELSYASIYQRESFPQTFVLIEGSSGSICLTHDFEIMVTTKSGSSIEKIELKNYEWINPDYAVVHSSIVDCNRDILQGLQGYASETTADDNLKTMKLVHSCYASAMNNSLIKITSH
ncbi:MAG: Gfo/Idh/MocA family oxidoreductase [Saprospiraceae bacterium]